MAENKVPNKKAICDALVQAAKTDRDIVVLCSDSRGSASFGEFIEQYPDQLVEVGIAEQDLVGVSAGLARCGKKAFAVSPACFLTTRSIEQVKVDVCYSHTNVKLIGISGGISYGALGMSHHSAQDVAYTASLPGMRERTLFLHGFSKAFAMTGWRIGYACGPREIIDAMMKVHQYAIMCASTMAQEAALELAGDAANASFDLALSAMKTVENALTELEKTFPEEITTALTENAQKAQDAMNAAKDEAFAKFEEAHKEDIEQALADLQARKQALIDANEAS